MRKFISMAVVLLMAGVMMPRAGAQDIGVFIDTLDAEAASSAEHDHDEHEKTAPGHSRQELTPINLDLKSFDVRNDELPGGMTQAELEAILQQNFMGSYFYYKRLDEAARELVYLQYQSQPRLDDVRQSIIHFGGKADDEG